MKVDNIDTGLKLSILLILLFVIAYNILQKGF